MARTYFIDRIDDESSEQIAETITAANDEDAKRQAKDIVTERGWNAAEVWDKDADMFIAEVGGMTAPALTWDAKGRRSTDGRWRISREILRGMSIWKLRDLTTGEEIGWYRTRRAAQEAAATREP